MFSICFMVTPKEMNPSDRPGLPRVPEVRENGERILPDAAREEVHLPPVQRGTLVHDERGVGAA